MVLLLTEPAQDKSLTSFLKQRKVLSNAFSVTPAHLKLSKGRVSFQGESQPGKNKTGTKYACHKYTGKNSGK